MKKVSEQNRDKAYYKGNFSTQIVIIRNLLKRRRKGLTIGEISKLINRPKSTVSGRIGDLKDELVVLGSKVDKDTNMTVTIWGLQVCSQDGKKKKVSNLSKLKDIEYYCKRNGSAFARKLLDIINDK